MSLNNWFNKAIPHQEYIDTMESHKENLLHIYKRFTLPEDEEFFSTLTNQHLRVIVITEDWCGDAMLNTPILLHLAEKTNMEVRMILRDQNLELMDQYLTNGKSRSIPIFIFIDESGNEVAKWGPRAESVQQFVNTIRTELPDKEAAEFKEKFNEMIQTMTQQFVSDEKIWNEVYKSLKNKLANLS
ncbi:thioredoxin family protein [Ornithinibacillus sp. BX22]|uniref:Thioredoxin family protein n=1 Tax=Ornithinibacillus hominis TaxID=2763055 RepID=A0A923L7Z8_9BACI|nr:thioredoxin family protein [Ornithinibacillus hominis]MBC5638191.1 thioredoxin family protein [Ornithinibacillus hominis]